MNSINSDGLKRIYLIQSADYQYANIDLTDTTLLLGASGVGKTTIMRAVLFFYTMDDSMLNIDTDSKKPFNQWYFKDNNSHIIYEYTKGDNIYLFIVSASGKLHYTFIDITNSNIGVKKLFLEEKTPANLQILTQNIQKNSLPSFNTVKKNEYIDIFHHKDIDGKKIYHKSKTNFALFNDINSRKEFAKTLLNIFKTSKITSSDIKETIISLIDNSSANIDLSSIREHFADYILEKTQIENFERKIPQINKLTNILEEYNKTKKDFKEKANEIKLFKDKSLQIIEEKKIKIDELETNKEEFKIDFLAEDKIQTKSIEQQQVVVTTNSINIEKLEEKKQEYKNKNINNLVVEHNKKDFFTKELKINESKLEALTSTKTEMQNKYKLIFETLEKDKDKNILKVKQLKIDEDKKITSQKESLIENRDKKIQEATKNLSIEKEALDKKLNKSSSDFNVTEIQQAKLENYPFNKENIDRYFKENERYKDELSSLEPKLIDNENKIENIDREILNISIKLKSDKDILSNEIDSQKKALFEKKENIEKKLNFDSDNLYGYINKSKLAHKQKIVTFIKDDILFSNREFKINKVDNSDTIFGMTIDFKEELPNNYDQTILLEQLKELKIQMQKLNKQFIEKSELLVNKANNETKIKDKERSRLYLEKKSLDEQKSKYIKHQSKSKTKLSFANNEAKELKSKETERLNKQYLEQKTTIESLTTQIKDLKEKIQNIEDEIKIDIRVKIDDLKSKSKILLEQEKSDIEKIDTDYNSSVETANKELLEILSAKGVDTKLFQEYKNNIDKSQQKLDDIEKNNIYVINYLEEYQKKINNIPSLQKQLEKNNKTLQTLKEKQENFKQKYNKKDKDIDNKINLQASMKNSLYEFLKKYDDKISNQQIQKDINNVISLEYNKLQEDLLNNREFMDEVISNIIELHNKIALDEGKIETSLMNCLRGLDKNNIFKLEIIDDYIDNNILEYIRVAKNLVEYIEKDKIKIFKDKSSDMFKSSINSIIKSLDMFDNAVSDIYTEVTKLKNSVNQAIKSFQVIDNIYLKAEDSNNEVLLMLHSLINFYNENSDKFLNGLFNIEIDNQQNKIAQDELSSKISDLVNLLIKSKEKLDLKDGFLLKFKVIEKGNDLSWRETLNDIGSNGTSTLVKSIINISMLQMVNKNMNKNQNLISHCILDEIGTISTDYFKELKDFVNSSGFHFLNGMPVEDDMLISMYPTVYVGEDCGSYSKMELVSKEVI